MPSPNIVNMHVIIVELNSSLNQELDILDSRMLRVQGKIAINSIV